MKVYYLDFVNGPILKFGAFYFEDPLASLIQSGLYLAVLSPATP